MNRFIECSAVLLCLLVTIPAPQALADAYSDCIAACNADLTQCKKDNDTRLERAQTTHSRCTRDADSNHNDRTRECNRQYRNNPARLEECLRNSDTTHTQDITACEAALSSAQEQHHRDSQACDSSFDACYGSASTDENGKTTYTGCQAKRCHCQTGTGQASGDSLVEEELLADTTTEACTCANSSVVTEPLDFAADE